MLSAQLKYCMRIPRGKREDCNVVRDVLDKYSAKSYYSFGLPSPSAIAVALVTFLVRFFDELLGPELTFFTLRMSIISTCH